MIGCDLDLAVGEDGECGVVIHFLYSAKELHPYGPQRPI